MYKLYPYFTNDGSVGLFSPDADDIYHSVYGALTEAYEKFILPANFEKYFSENNEIKILDICFGIGYNTKSFLNYLIDFYYNESIDSNNIKYNNKIDTDNKKCKIFIHAIDTDKNLACLSPFFISNKTNIKNNKLIFKNEKIKRMLSNNIQTKFKLNKEVNILLLEKIHKYIDNDIMELLNKKQYSVFFDKNIRRLFEFYRNEESIHTSLKKINTFLHNIYYRHLSNSYKMYLNILKWLDFDFKLSIKDARCAILNDTNKYNYIFLDAFTPTKCPCLWTVDFFKLLFEHLEDNGMILTYSNSALVRNAFLNAGFQVGKIYSDSAKKFTGTIATKNKAFIKYDLSEYDLGLIKTKAGIFYRDENLNLDNESIIAAHKVEVENSNLMSSSRFIKHFKVIN